MVFWAENEFFGRLGNWNRDPFLVCHRDLALWSIFWRLGFEWPGVFCIWKAWISGQWIKIFGFASVVAVTGEVPQCVRSIVEHPLRLHPETSRHSSPLDTGWLDYRRKLAFDLGAYHAQHRPVSATPLADAHGNRWVTAGGCAIGHRLSICNWNSFQTTWLIRLCLNSMRL